MDDLFNFDYDFGALIREERKSQGMSMRELGKLVGISEQAISQYELGKRPLKYSMAEKIASELGTSVPKILYDNEVYTEEIPEAFNGDVVAYGAAKEKARMFTRQLIRELNAVEKLLETYGVKYQEIGEQYNEEGDYDITGVRVVDEVGKEFDLTMTQFELLGSMLSQAIKGFALYKHHEIIQDLLSNHDD